jgi:hypothetical protein
VLPTGTVVTGTVTATMPGTLNGPDDCAATGDFSATFTLERNFLSSVPSYQGSEVVAVGNGTNISLTLVLSCVENQYYSLAIVHTSFNGGDCGPLCGGIVGAVGSDDLLIHDQFKNSSGLCMPVGGSTESTAPCDVSFSWSIEIVYP